MSKLAGCNFCRSTASRENIFNAIPDRSTKLTNQTEYSQIVGHYRQVGFD